MPTNTDEPSEPIEFAEAIPEPRELDQWSSLTCATCDTVTRVSNSELDQGSAVSCRTCWQPISVDEQSNSPNDETRHADDTVLNGARLQGAEQLARYQASNEPDEFAECSAIETVAASKRTRKISRIRRKESASRNRSDSASEDDVETEVDSTIEKSPDVNSRGGDSSVVDRGAKKSVVLTDIQIQVDSDESEEKGWTSLKRGLERRRDDFAGAIVSVVLHMLLWVILAAIVVKFNEPWGDSSFSLSISSEATLLDGEVEHNQEPLDEATASIVPMHQVRVDHLVAGGSGGGGAASDADFKMPNSDEFRHGTGDAKWSIEAGQGFGGRSIENRLQRAIENGGSPESEDAVESGLKWLAKKQREDGSWDFSEGPNIVLGRASRTSGKQEPMAATALALMCYMGAGYTHDSDKYQEQVKQALEYLKKHQSRTGDCRGKGDMYSHGLVSIALCEAYGMTGDRSLREPAQSSLTFIEQAQHSAGGWRYSPKQAGDTSVVGWQVMAIASGRMAGLDTSRVVNGQAVRFLDSVCNKKTGTYGYTNAAGAFGASTAIGTLSRMYLHFGFDPQVMQKSVNATAKVDPVGKDLYSRYYAMQVLHHVGGRVWKSWNPKCRDHLVGRQTKTGTNAGSWSPISKWSSRGGARHYETCMSIMCLEVYYRHMRIYQDAAFK